MATLDFKGPFHWDHVKPDEIKSLFDEKITDSSSNNNSSNDGIYLDIDEGNIKEVPIDNYNINDYSKHYFYIWGTSVDQYSNIANVNRFVPISGLKNVIDFNLLKWKLIPYYVGETSNIVKRMNEHHCVNDPSKNANKYTRLVNQRIYDVLSDTHFAKEIIRYISPTTIPNPKIPLDSITYFNNNDVLKLIYNNNIKISGNRNHGLHFPISNQKLLNNNNLPDPLNYAVIENNNFFFIVAEINIVKKSPDNRRHTMIKKIIESYIFFSLIGYTISKIEHDLGQFITPNLDLSNPSTQNNVFKLNNKVDFDYALHSGSASLNYPGNFPGYY